MAIALVVKQSTVFGGTGGTTSSINTTGANLIMVALTYHDSTPANISDSKGNTWNILTKEETTTPGAGAVIYYATNPTVGSGHTFTTTSHFCGVNILAVSGARTATTPFDQQNGAQQFVGSGTTFQPGAITTSVAGCVVITCVTNFNGTAPTIPSGYTSIGTYTTATAEAGGAAYLILSGTSTENPTWSGMTNSNPWASVVADFMPPGAAVTNTGNFFMFM